MLIAGLPSCPLGLPSPLGLSSSPRSWLARRMREASWALGQNEEQQPREDQASVTRAPSAKGCWDLWSGCGAGRVPLPAAAVETPERKDGEEINK